MSKTLQIVVPNNRELYESKRIKNTWRSIINESKYHFNFQKVDITKLKLNKIPTGDARFVFDNYLTFLTIFCPFKNTTVSQEFSDKVPGGFFTLSSYLNDDNSPIKHKISKSELLNDNILVDEIKILCKFYKSKGLQPQAFEFDAEKELKKDPSLIDKYEDLVKLRDKIIVQYDSILTHEDIKTIEKKNLYGSNTITPSVQLGTSTGTKRRRIIKPSSSKLNSNLYSNSEVIIGKDTLIRSRECKQNQSSNRKFVKYEATIREVSKKENIYFYIIIILSLLIIFYMLVTI